MSKRVIWEEFQLPMQRRWPSSLRTRRRRLGKTRRSRSVGKRVASRRLTEERVLAGAGEVVMRVFDAVQSDVQS